MADIKATWQRLGDKTSIENGADVFREIFKEVASELSKKGVYVIRFCRPFSIAYPERHSPVLYIGQGNTRQRVNSHMEGWINELANDLPAADVEVYYTEPRIQNNTAGHKDIEADLIDRFHETYGAIPIINKRYEYHPRNHTYIDDFFKILGPMKGPGFRWAISPLASNTYFFRSYEWDE